MRKYEHQRWANEPNRRMLPFAWGIEHIGGRCDETDPRGFLEEFVQKTLATSSDWFASSPPQDCELHDGILTFSSEIQSPWPENNRVYAQWFQASGTGPAVVVLAQWNAKWDEQREVCLWLNDLGISALRVSLPYHDRRAIPGHPRADHLVGPNIGLTLQANHQAVCDVRRSVRWLESQGYGPLGILGTSIGSALAYVTLAHEPALRAGAFLHVSTYFGTVVASGLTTLNVWESLRAHVTPEELVHFWAPISPFPYISRLRSANKKMLLISGRYDPTFSTQLTQELFQAMSEHQIAFETLELPCGHYSLGVKPFSYIAGFRFGMFLLDALKPGISEAQAAARFP
ncbi:MAG: dienelactone hydrolase family protein [Candidatus Acidiferrales bacterium]